MSTKLVVAALLVVLFEVAHGSGPFSSIRDKLLSRESPEIIDTIECLFEPNYPAACVTAVSDLDNLLATTMLSDVVSSELSVMLDTLCTSECIGPYVKFYNCIGEADFGELYNNAFCGLSNGTNCLVLYVDGVQEGSLVEAPSCVSNGSCGLDCQAWMQNTTDYLGCCTTSWFGNPESFLYNAVPLEDFQSCGVDLEEPCDGVYDGVIRVESGAAVIAAVVLASLLLF